MTGRVLVVGAGLAGLAAAVRLRERGLEVRVIEPGLPGGTARTIEPRPGWRVEWGPHSLTHRAKSVFTLAEAVGVGDALVKLGAVAGRRYLVRDGRLGEASPLGAGLTWGERWELLRGLFRVAPPARGESVASWLGRQFGPRFAAGAGSALTVGIWATGPESVAVDAGLPALAEALRTRGAPIRAMRGGAPPARAAGTWGFVGGIGTLTGAAARWLGQGAFLAGAARRVEGGADGAAVDGEDADGVVVAVPADVAAGLLDRPDLAEVRYSPLVVAHWLAREVELPRGFGWLAPPSERRRVLGTVFVSDLVPERAPAGCRSFATMIGGTFEPGAIRIDDAGILGRVEEEVRALTGARPGIEAIEVVRHRQAVAIPGPGHLERVARALDGLPSRVVVAGAWTGAGSMEDAARSGFAAAERLAAELGVGRVG